MKTFFARLTFDSDRRIARVCAFVILIGLLNAYDLSMTIKAVEHGVMFEANPIADMVIDQYGSPGLALFKCTVVGPALALFLVGRRTVISEYGALFGVVVYVGVAILWMNYPLDVLVNQSYAMHFQQRP